MIRALHEPAGGQGTNRESGSKEETALREKQRRPDSREVAPTKRCGVSGRRGDEGRVHRADNRRLPPAGCRSYRHRAIGALVEMAAVAASRYGSRTVRCTA